MKTYLRLLNLLSGITDSGVDLIAEKLLEKIALAHSKGHPLTVTTAMEMHQLASPATLHRKMNVLMEAGLVDQVFEGKNRRTKYLVPTPKAFARFEEIGRLIKSVSV